MVGFSMIAMSQIRAFLMQNTFEMENPADATIFKVGMMARSLSLLTAIAGIILSRMYKKSGETKFNILNKTGFILAIITIIMTLIPLHLFLSK